MRSDPEDLPALAAVNWFAAVRGETLRIAPHLYVTATDVDRLVRALATVMTGSGYR